MLKVAMICRSTLYKVKGGDTIQVLETARGLTELGVAVDIKLASERVEYNNYDLLHFYNIIRPADILCHIERSSLPFVVSTILVDYSEFDMQNRAGITGWVLRLFTDGTNEYIKTLARAILLKDKLPGLSYILNGHTKSIDRILKRASLLLPGSENEYERLKNRFNCN